MAVVGRITEDFARRGARVIKRVEAWEDDSAYPAGGKVYPDGIRWVPFKNDSAETVPSHGIMRIKTDVEIDDALNVILKCTKPDEVFSRQYAVNSGTPIPPGSYGLCRVSGDVLVAFDVDGDDTPAADEGWGPKPGSWFPGKGYPQALLVAEIQDAENGVMLATLGPIDDFYCFAPSVIDAASGDITAAGVTPGIGSVKPCYYDGSVWGKIDDEMSVAEVQNLAPQEVAASVILRVKFVDGIPTVVWEACG